MGITARFNFLCFSLIAGSQAVAPGQPAGDILSAHPAVTDETAISLDGIWRFRPSEAAELDLVVPSFWDREPGLRDVHQGVFQRNFDVPGSFRGRRIVLLFDAVGDAADVSVNGQHAGGHVGPDLPFEIDLSGLVSAPSSSNRLEVMVRDDSFFSVPRQAKDGRNRETWLPRGMGANNRKGIYQSVTFLARPPVWLADTRIQTSVRRHEITVRCQIFNSVRQTVRARLSAEVLSVAGGTASLTFPQQEVELPGYVTTTAVLSLPFGTGGSALATRSPCPLSVTVGSGRCGGSYCGFRNDLWVQGGVVRRDSLLPERDSMQSAGREPGLFRKAGDVCDPGGHHGNGPPLPKGKLQYPEISLDAGATTRAAGL